MTNIDDGSQQRKGVRTLVVIAAWVVMVAAFPVAWLLGYQDHPWHLHTAANWTAGAFFAASIVLHVLGRRLEPPVSGLLTGAATIVATAALVAAVIWDVYGRPTEDEVIGPGAVAPVILVATIAVLGAAVAIGLRSSKR